MIFITTVVVWFSLPLIGVLCPLCTAANCNPLKSCTSKEKTRLLLTPDYGQGDAYEGFSSKRIKCSVLNNNKKNPLYSLSCLPLGTCCVRPVWKHLDLFELLNLPTSQHFWSTFQLQTEVLIGLSFRVCFSSVFNFFFFLNLCFYRLFSRVTAKHSSSYNSSVYFWLCRPQETRPADGTF